MALQSFDLKNENLKKFINEISANIGTAVNDMRLGFELSISKNYSDVGNNKQKRCIQRKASSWQ